MKAIKNIFNKLIQTPLIGSDEKKVITEHFNSLTSENEMLVICKQIEYNYCTEEFIKNL